MSEKLNHRTFTFYLNHISKKVLYNVMTCFLHTLHLMLWKNGLIKRNRLKYPLLRSYGFTYIYLHHYEPTHSRTNINNKSRDVCLLSAPIYSPKNWQNWLQNSLTGYDFCKENKEQLTLFTHISHCKDWYYTSWFWIIHQ